VLAHKERLTTRHSQADIAARRMREYAESGRHPGPLPTPGVFARHNAVDTPALLPDGTPSELSVSRVLTARGQVGSATPYLEAQEEIERDLAGHDDVRASSDPAKPVTKEDQT
jgi:NADH-quinone oxidoreductase subunit J